MYKAALLRNTLVVTALGLSLGSVAFAGETENSSMAGGMSDSQAQEGTTSSAGGLSATGSHATIESSSSSTSEASTSSSAKDSGMVIPIRRDPISPMGIPANDNGSVSNRGTSATTSRYGNVRGGAGVNGGNGLINNAVKQPSMAADKVPVNVNSSQIPVNVTTAADEAQNASSPSGKSNKSPATRAPHAKTQYWNQARPARH